VVSELTGEPIHAVLPPPQLRRFRELARIAEDETIEVVVHGWHKLVLLTADRAFLFPRHAVHVAGLERELAALAALTAAAVPLVPQLLDRWHDGVVHPHPFAAVSRLPGEPLDDPVGLFDQLGRAIAAWHDLAPPTTLAAPPPVDPAHVLPHQRWLRRALDPAASADAVIEATERLGLPERRQQWTEQLGAAAQLRHVLVHGDIHEDQLLADADGSTLTGILDWETARIDHPFFDFDFGEWGTALWRDHLPELADLWLAQWEPYARERRLDLPVEPLVSAFGIRQMLVEARPT
jgi:aminoglycoside phosphotransferase (APT) family kinase protein